MMELRWHTTYDKNGEDCPTTLQYREDENEEWEDVPDIRERGDE